MAKVQVYITITFNICLTTLIDIVTPVIPVIYDFSKLKSVTGWMFRFISNCQTNDSSQFKQSSLSVSELQVAENYWISLSQRECFCKELALLRERKEIDRSSNLISLSPMLDSHGIIRVSGRQSNLKASYNMIHPVIVHGKHHIVKLIIQTEHLRLLHGGPTLVHTSLSRKFQIIGGRRFIRDTIRQCITCRKLSAKPKNQRMGDLPIERVTPGLPFDKVGVDYAGPFYVKHGYVRKPTVVKAYACVFVSLSVKAVHLELVSDLTSDAFISCLRRFTARRGKPSLIMSDHGTNFVGANRELKEIDQFLQQQKTQRKISEFCSNSSIRWKFIPERSPHFGGLWEAAVKAMKTHLKRVIGDTKLTFEELTMLLAQVEVCLNSRPLTPLPSTEDGIEVLTPGHFLIGQPLESIPDSSVTYRSMSYLTRWHPLTRHFWQRWSDEYLTNMRKITKWHHPSRNLRIGDIVVLKEDGLIPTKWPLARIVETHPGKDDHVRVATIKTATGTYKRPITNLVLLLPLDECELFKDCPVLAGGMFGSIIRIDY